MFDLSKKRAMVTGGSRGIGSGIVRRLAEAGADVGFTYKSQKDAASRVAKSVENLGVRALAVEADSLDAKQLSHAVNEVAGVLGGLDIFVSSTGALPFKPIGELTLDDFEQVVALDLRAAFVGSKAALEHLPAGGRIIFISSNMADYAALPATAFYAMVKSGLDGLCKGMARDLGPKGITVNSVHLGPINTGANSEGGQYTPDLKRLMATAHFGTPADVGAMVTFLASPEAAFISGSIHHVDSPFAA